MVPDKYETFKKKISEIGIVEVSILKKFYETQIFFKYI